MPDNILFYLVFFSQIILISFYYPKEILSRLNYVFKTYPSAEYPRLYVKSIEFYERKQQLFKVVNHIILGIGFLLLLAIAVWDYQTEGHIDQIIPWLYFMIQALPLMILEYSGFAYFKLMRKADKRTIRMAELFPRRLFSFISPIFLGLALVLIIVCLATFYSMHNFEFHPRNDTFIIGLTLILSNLFYAGIIYWNLYGKKLNPFQKAKDRMKQIEGTIKSLVFLSIAASIFLILNGTVEYFQLDYLESAMMSIYLQLIIFIGLGTALRSMKVENIDFDVYKEVSSISVD